MKFTINWLKSFLPGLDLDPEELADRLTMLGLEVEAVQPLYQGLDSIVIARVEEVRKHPNADRLYVCSVFTGTETIQVVCGAPNVRQGMISALALPGARLPGGMKIKKAKVRGELSQGMLCSWSELDLGEDHSGIMELDGALSPGTSLVRALDLDDIMIEVDLTPNRADCASVMGIAREVAAFTGLAMEIPVTTEPPRTGEAEYTVTVERPDLCPRYSARKLTGIRIGPSPWWLQRQLLAVGMRPINNIVDVTNFVMLEYGQPLHAFDFARLRQAKIVVRCPLPQERHFVTLDGVERELRPEMLMICDGEGPVAVAGVMGGLDSEVTSETTDVLLEAACFDPVSIRRTARALNLPSEASYRFERGVDPNIALLAQQRAVQLILEIAGGKADDGTVDVYPAPRNPLALSLRPAKVCELVGESLPPERIAAHLRSIEFHIDDVSDEAMRVTVPTFRNDITREVDLVEEIARLVGYNELPTTMPEIVMDYPRTDPMRRLRQRIGGVCTSSGYFEAINYSFTDIRHLDALRLPEDDVRRKLTRLLNPLAEDQAVMRSTLLPGLLENVCRNINHQQADLRMFEIGKIFLQRDPDAAVQPEERYQLCAVCSGARYPGAPAYHFSGLDADLLDMKGLLESIVGNLDIVGRDGEPLQYVGDPVGCASYCPAGIGLALKDGEREIGWIGQVADSVLRDFGIKQPVFFLELDLEYVAELPEQKKRFTPIARYPYVKRDIALLVPEKVPAGALLDAIRASRAKYVESVELFDVYSGKPIERGMKSVAISVTYRSKEETLDDATVDSVHEKIVQSLMSEFNARYREGTE